MTRARECTGKVRHETKAEAQQHKGWLHRVWKDRALTVYPCRFCGGWHVGHRRGPKRHKGAWA